MSESDETRTLNRLFDSIREQEDQALRWVKEGAFSAASDAIHFRDTLIVCAFEHLLLWRDETVRSDAALRLWASASTARIYEDNMIEQAMAGNLRRMLIERTQRDTAIVDALTALIAWRDEQ